MSNRSDGPPMKHRLLKAVWLRTFYLHLKYHWFLWRKAAGWEGSNPVFSCRFCPRYETILLYVGKAMKSTTACMDYGRMTVRYYLQLYAKRTPLLQRSRCPLGNSLDLVVLAVCDSHRLKSSNHTSHCYVVGGKRWGQQRHPQNSIQT